MAEPDAAVAIVHARGASDSVLLIRRAEREADPWSGHWSFPGGRRDPEDGDLLHTALRELQEECGIGLARERLEAAMPYAVARRSAGRFLLVAPFVFGVDGELPLSLDAREAAEAMWVPLSVLRDPARHALWPAPGLPPEVRFPAIDLNGVRLWGFTYRLITDWLDLNPREIPVEEAGFQVARALLDAIVAHGGVLVHGWVDRDGAKVAAVRGRIPVEVVLAQASGCPVGPAAHIPRINMLEARPDRVRLVGLGFEEYVIHADPTSRRTCSSASLSGSRSGTRTRYSALNSSISRAANLRKSSRMASPDSSCELSTRTVFGRAFHRPSTRLPGRLCTPPSAGRSRRSSDGHGCFWFTVNGIWMPLPLPHGRGSVTIALVW